MPHSKIEKSPSPYYDFTAWTDFFVILPRCIEGKIVMFKMCQWRQKYYTDNWSIFDQSETQWRLKP